MNVSYLISVQLQTTINTVDRVTYWPINFNSETTKMRELVKVSNKPTSYKSRYNNSLNLLYKEFSDFIY